MSYSPYAQKHFNSKLLARATKYSHFKAGIERARANMLHWKHSEPDALMTWTECLGCVGVETMDEARARLTKIGGDFPAAFDKLLTAKLAEAVANRRCYAKHKMFFSPCSMDGTCCELDDVDPADPIKKSKGPTEPVPVDALPVDAGPSTRGRDRVGAGTRAAPNPQPVQREDAFMFVFDTSLPEDELATLIEDTAADLGLELGRAGSSGDQTQQPDEQEALDRPNLVLAAVMEPDSSRLRLELRRVESSSDQVQQPDEQQDSAPPPASPQPQFTSPASAAISDNQLYDLDGFLIEPEHFNELEPWKRDIIEMLCLCEVLLDHDYDGQHLFKTSAPAKQKRYETPTYWGVGVGDV